MSFGQSINGNFVNLSPPKREKIKLYARIFGTRA